MLAVGAVVAGLSAIVPGGTGAHEASPGEQAIRLVQDAMDVPDGMTLVGYRGIAVTVPEEWSRDAQRCGTPAENTVLLPLGAVCAAYVPYPAETTSVTFSDQSDYYSLEDAEVTTPVRIGGLEFASTGVVCGDRQMAPCEIRMESAAAGVSLTISSSLTPESTARGQLEELVAGVRVLDETTATVPSTRVGDHTRDLGFEANGATQYADLLVDAGLVPRIEEVYVPPAQEGSVQGLSPVPGSVLPRGTEVTIYAAAPPQTPADEISVDGRYSRPDNGTSITDEEIRRGTTIQVELGDSIIVTGQKQLVEGTEEYDEAVENGFSDLYVLLGGTLDGSSIEVVENDRVAMWQAVELGTTVLTVTYEKDGRAYDVGTIDVEVVG